MRTLAFILLCSITLSHGATSWYVDDDATGANDGSSWTDAWTNVNQIDVSGLSAGDDVQLAGGFYYDMSNLNKNGSSGNHILIQLAQDTNYQGHVWITNVTGSVNLWADYLIINGAFDTNFVVPDSVHDLDVITNNIGLHITSPGLGGISFGNGDATGNKVLWTHIYNCGDFDGPTFPASGEANENAISIGDIQTDCELAYIWFDRNIWGDSVNSTDSHNNLSVHDCLFYTAGDDVFQVNGGFDFYRCKIKWREWGWASGHSDVWQTWGSDIKIHHNIVEDFGAPQTTNGVSDYSSFAYFQTSDPLNHDIYVYNNLMIDQDTNRFCTPGFKFSHDAWWSTNNGVAKYCTNNVISNLFVVNNLFHRPNGRPYGHTFYWVAADSSRGTNDMFTLTNCHFANNIIVDSYNRSGAQLGGTVTDFPTVTDAGATPNGDTWGPIVSDYWVSNNVIMGPNYSILTGQDEYESIIAAEASDTRVQNSSTNEVNFRYYVADLSSPKFNFRLNLSDTVAKENGINFSGVTNLMPYLDRDLDWNQRPTTGSWDIGPYYFGGESLILYLDFDDTNWVSNGYITDMSGRENHAHEFGFGNGINWPLLVTSTNGTWAAEFNRWTNTTLSTGQEGRYAAITNVNDFTNLNAMTFSVWSLLLAATNADWSQENDQTFIDAGYGYKGGFTYSKDGNLAWRTRLWTNSVNTDDPKLQVLQWPQLHGSGSGGSTSGWHMFTFTYDGSNFIGYQDGLSFQTNTTQEDILGLGVTNLHMRKWIGVGVKTHYTVTGPQETPDFGDDLYPNHGWLHAYVDELRVYNKTLDADEVYNLYLGGGAGGSVQDEGGGDPDPEPTYSPVRAARTFGRGRGRF